MYLITRPQEDAVPIASALAERGLDTMIEPMMTVDLDRSQIRALDEKLAKHPGLIFTSVNGVRAFTALSDMRGVHAYAVGETTGQACQDAGFQSVSVADGDSISLGALIETHWQTKQIPLLHVAGKSVAGDLCGRLSKAGFHVSRIALYDAVACEVLSTEIQSALKLREIQGILFFSPRTARIFVKLLELHGLCDTVTSVTAHCLSPAVSSEIKEAGFETVYVATFPDRENLLQTVWNAQ